MKLPIFTSFLLFVILLQFLLRRTEKKANRRESAYWQREKEAQHTPAKPIEDLPYVKLPESLLPECLPDNPEARECREALLNLSREKVINLQGMSNTDIRLTYGTRNYEILSEADTRYIIMIRNLAKLAEIYENSGLRSEAKKLLEFGLSIGSDVRRNYTLLGKIYLEEENTAAFVSLIKRAEGITSLSREPVLKELGAMKPSGPLPEEGTDGKKQAGEEERLEDISLKELDVLFEEDKQ
ncbi:MAG: hypothetical protein K5985_09740 [Lachnospiraceae bacterium]|nr:hypothetical protein [Lachnospiraceae bacterium]